VQSVSTSRSESALTYGKNKNNKVAIDNITLKKHGKVLVLRKETNVSLDALQRKEKQWVT